MKQKQLVELGVKGGVLVRKTTVEMLDEIANAQMNAKETQDMLVRQIGEASRYKIMQRKRTCMIRLEFDETEKPRSAAITIYYGCPWTELVEIKDEAWEALVNRGAIPDGELREFGDNKIVIKKKRYKLGYIQEQILSFLDETWQTTGDIALKIKSKGKYPTNIAYRALLALVKRGLVKKKNMAEYTVLGRYLWAKT